MINNKVSIIVPIYNVEKYIEKCLKSLISQTYKNIEILAIIDGSMDNSKNIVEKYIKLDNRIKCIDKENGGYGSVLELAISIIETEYFLICDPDDWLKNNAVEELIKATKVSDNIDIVIGDKINVFSNNSEQYCSSSQKDYEVIPNVLLEGDDLSKIAFLEVSPHSKLYRTSCVKNLKFPYHVNYTDFLLYIYAIINANKAIYINKALSYYLIDREGNSATDKSYRSLKSQLIVYNEIMKYVKKTNKIDLYYRMYIQFRYPLLNIASKIDRNDYNKIKKDLIKAFLDIDYKSEIKFKIKFNNKLKQIFNKIVYSGLCSKIFRNLTIKVIIYLNKFRNYRSSGRR